METILPKPKGKYAHVTATLPKLPLVEPERRDIVEAVKEEILTSEAPDAEVTPLEMIQTIEGAVKQLLTYEKRVTGGKQRASDYAHAYAQLRLIKDKMDDWTSNFQLLLDAYTELLVLQMDQEGMPSLRLANGSSISTHAEPYGQVKDREAFRLWCIENGFEQKLMLWPSTMNSLVKERTLEGEPPPDGVEVFAKTVVRFNT